MLRFFLPLGLTFVTFVVLGSRIGAGGRAALAVLLFGSFVAIFLHRPWRRGVPVGAYAVLGTASLLFGASALSITRGERYTERALAEEAEVAARYAERGSAGSRREPGNGSSAVPRRSQRDPVPQLEPDELDEPDAAMPPPRDPIEACLAEADAALAEPADDVVAHDDRLAAALPCLDAARHDGPREIRRAAASRRSDLVRARSRIRRAVREARAR